MQISSSQSSSYFSNYKANQKNQGVESDKPDYQTKSIPIDIDKVRDPGFFSPLKQAPKEMLDKIRMFKSEITYTNSPGHIEEFLSRSRMEGEKREAIAIFSVDGKQIARVNTNGASTTPNNISHKALTDPSPRETVEFLEKTLGRQYGDELVIDKYQPGHSPSNAEIFERFHYENSYKQHIDVAVEAMRNEYAATQYLRQQHEEEQTRTNSVEQKELFKINGKVVASLDFGGKLRIHASLIGDESEKMGMRRDATQGLTAVELRSFNNPVNGDDVAAMFRDEFGDSLEVEKFTKGSGPTFGAVREIQNQHLSEQWKKIDVKV